MKRILIVIFLFNIIVITNANDNLNIEITNFQDIKISEIQDIDIHGKINTNNNIASVRVKVNDGKWYIPNSNDQFKTFNLNVSLMPGNNKILVFANDEYGDYTSYEFQVYYKRVGTKYIQFEDVKAEMYRRGILYIRFKTSCPSYVRFDIGNNTETGCQYDLGNRFVFRDEYKTNHSVIIPNIKINYEYCYRITAENVEKNIAYYDGNLKISDPLLNKNIPSKTNEAFSPYLYTNKDECFISWMEKYRIKNTNILTSDIYVNKWDDKYGLRSNPFRLNRFSNVIDFDFDKDEDSGYLWGVSSYKINDISKISVVNNKDTIFKTISQQTFPPEYRVYYVKKQRKIKTLDNSMLSSYHKPKILIINNEVYVIYQKQHKNNNINLYMMTYDKKHQKWLQLGTRININTYFFVKENIYFLNYNGFPLVMWKEGNHIRAQYWNSYTWILLKDVSDESYITGFSSVIADNELYSVYINSKKELNILQYSNSKWENKLSKYKIDFDIDKFNNQSVTYIPGNLIIALGNSKKINLLKFDGKQIQYLKSIESNRNIDIEDYAINSTKEHIHLSWIEEKGIYHKTLKFNQGK